MIHTGFGYYIMIDEYMITVRKEKEKRDEWHKERSFGKSEVYRDHGTGNRRRICIRIDKIF